LWALFKNITPIDIWNKKKPHFSKLNSTPMEMLRNTGQDWWLEVLAKLLALVTWIFFSLIVKIDFI
jgi:hypothetical protein